jgi:cytochrome b561
LLRGLRLLRAMGRARRFFAQYASAKRHRCDADAAYHLDRPLIFAKAGALRCALKIFAAERVRRHPMSSNIARHGRFAVALHVLATLGVLASLALAFFLWRDPTTTLERARLVDLHMALGLIVAAVAALQLLASWIGAPDYPGDFPKWRRYAAKTATGALFLCLATALASGVAQTAFSGAPTRIFGLELAPLADPDAEKFALAAQIHIMASFALAGAVAGHLIVVALNALAYRGTAARMSPFGAGAVAAVPALVPASGSKRGRELAGRFRLIGWITFILQFILAVLSALLLQFSAAGRAITASVSSIGDAIFWGAGALAALILGCALAFYTIRVANAVERAPEKYLGAKRGGFLFLGAGAAISALGALAALAGLALSIVLLIAKTVSQPPGIAITDPNHIIRALDVFILLVNFNLLIAHVFGAAAFGGLLLLASRAKAAFRAAAVTPG